MAADYIIPGSFEFGSNFSMSGSTFSVYTDFNCNYGSAAGNVNFFANAGNMNHTCSGNMISTCGGVGTFSSIGDMFVYSDDLLTMYGDNVSLQSLDGNFSITSTGGINLTNFTAGGINIEAVSGFLTCYGHNGSSYVDDVVIASDAPIFYLAANAALTINIGNVFCATNWTSVTSALTATTSFEINTPILKLQNVPLDPGGTVALRIDLATGQVYHA